MGREPWRPSCLSAGPGGSWPGACQALGREAPQEATQRCGPRAERKHTSKPCRKPGRVRGLYLSSPDITASLDFRKGGRKSWTQAFRPGSSSLPTGATEPRDAPGLAWGPDAEAASRLQKDNSFHQGWAHLQEDRSGQSQPPLALLPETPQTSFSHDRDRDGRGWRQMK